MSEVIQAQDRQILEIWTQPERAMYIEVFAGKYSVDWLQECINDEHTVTFTVESVDGKVYVLATRNIHFAVLHPANVATPAF